MQRCKTSTSVAAHQAGGVPSRLLLVRELLCAAAAAVAAEVRRSQLRQAGQHAVHVHHVVQAHTLARLVQLRGLAVSSSHLLEGDGTVRTVSR